MFVGHLACLGCQYFQNSTIIAQLLDAENTLKPKWSAVQSSKHSNSKNFIKTDQAEKCSD